MTQMKFVGGIWLCLVLLCSTLACSAEQPSAQPDVAKILDRDYPKLKYEAIHPSPVKGLYEVLSGNRIYYFAPETSHLLVGDLWNKDGVNLSKNRLGDIMGERIKDLDLDKALKIGDGKNIVIEVTDPDCPFCRKGSAFFSSRTDTTRYIFFLPLKMHPNAEKKSRYILSSEDPAEAYEEAMSGKFDKDPVPEYKDNGLLDYHKKATDILGVKGTPNYWVNGTYISGANLKSIEKLLK